MKVEVRDEKIVMIQESVTIIDVETQKANIEQIEMAIKATDENKKALEAELEKAKDILNQIEGLQSSI